MQQEEGLLSEQPGSCCRQQANRRCQPQPPPGNRQISHRSGAAPEDSCENTNRHDSMTQRGGHTPGSAVRKNRRLLLPAYREINQQQNRRRQCQQGQTHRMHFHQESFFIHRCQIQLPAQHQRRQTKTEHHIRHQLFFHIRSLHWAILSIIECIIPVRSPNFHPQAKKLFVNDYFLFCPQKGSIIGSSFNFGGKVCFCGQSPYFLCC